MAFQAFLLCVVLCVGVYGQYDSTFYPTGNCPLSGGTIEYNTQTQRCHYTRNGATGTWGLLNVSIVVPVSGNGGTQNIPWPHGSCSLTNVANPAVSSTQFTKQNVSSWLDCCTDLSVNNIVYDRFTHFCCDGRRNGAKIANAQVIARDPNNEDMTEACCGNQLYDTTTQTCCQGNIFAISATHKCCGNAMMPTATKFCCKGVQYNKVTTGCNSRSANANTHCAWDTKLYDTCCHTFDPISITNYYHTQLPVPFGSGVVKLNAKSGRPAWCV